MGLTRCSQAEEAGISGEWSWQPSVVSQEQLCPGCAGESKRGGKGYGGGGEDWGGIFVNLVVEAHMPNYLL